MDTSKIALFTNPGETIDVSPEEAIITMFEHTDENGTLFIPDLSDENPRIYRCAMQWNREDADRAIAEYCRLYGAVKALAESGKELQTEAELARLPEDLRNVWHTFIRPWEAEACDNDFLAYTYMRYNTIAHVNLIAEKIAAGTASREEALYYDMNKDTTVPKAEEAAYTEHQNALRADAGRRVGDRLGAYHYVVCVKRLYRAMTLKAPEIIVRREASRLAEALVLYTYCTSMESVPCR